MSDGRQRGLLKRRATTRPERGIAAHETTDAGAPRDSLAPTLAAIVRARLSLPWTKARELVTTGRVTVSGQIDTDPARRVLDETAVQIDPTAKRLRRSGLPDGAIVHADHHVVVVDKPAHVSTVPYEEGERDTLVDLVRTALRRAGGGFDPMLGVVHRLDKETTGLLVFARTLAAKRHLEAQMRAHTAERVYLAIAHGAVAKATHRTWLLPDRGDGLRGSWGVFRRARGARPDEARESITHVEPQSRLRAATLCRCRLDTGRQHQIRIHLSESGHPLVGEKVYVREHRGPTLSAPRVMLHSFRLTFRHPATEEDVTFERAPPPDFEEVLARLRSPR